MWVFVMFDLPVTTKPETKLAALFRKGLLQNGFTMLQYSVYIKHVPSAESADVFIERVKKIRPPEGDIMILKITDKQFGDIVNVRGTGKKLKTTSQGTQLEFF